MKQMNDETLFHIKKLMRERFKEERLKEVTMKLQILFLTIFLLVSSVLPQDTQPSLWGGTSLGMSPNEVLQAVPNSKLFNSTVPGSGTLVCLDNVEILDYPFKVYFRFDSKRLELVKLNLQKVIYYNESLTLFESLTEVLTFKYGDPIHSKIDKSIHCIDATWVSGMNDISIWTFESSRSGEITFSIIYTTRLKKEAEKL